MYLAVRNQSKIVKIWRPDGSARLVRKRIVGFKNAGLLDQDVSSQISWQNDGKLEYTCVNTTFW